MILFNVSKQRILVEHPTCNDDDPLGSALERHAKMSLKERSLAPGVHELRQVALRLQVIFNSMDDRNAERIGKVISDDADHPAAVAAQRARKCIRMVSERLRNLANMLACRCGYVLRQRRIIKNNGDRGYGKAACFGDIKQRHMISEILLSVLRLRDDPPLREKGIDLVLKISYASTFILVRRRCCSPGILKHAQAAFISMNWRCKTKGHTASPGRTV